MDGCLESIVPKLSIRKRDQTIVASARLRAQKETGFEFTIFFDENPVCQIFDFERGRVYRSQDRIHISGNIFNNRDS